MGNWAYGGLGCQAGRGGDSWNLDNDWFVGDAIAMHARKRWMNSWRVLAR